MKTHYGDIAAYVTRDGSEIRELMHPARHGNRNQSLAEATIPAGTRTIRHRHLAAEEIYHVTAGTGLMTLGGETFAMIAGDTVLIPPGTVHGIEATGSGPLRMLCCCSPAYAHEDTELVEAASEQT